MTDNPYAAPQEGSDPKPTSETRSLLPQIIWQALAGGAYAAVVFFGAEQIPAIQRFTLQLGAFALLGIGFGCRAWFCIELRQLITAATALSWGFLWSLGIQICIQDGEISLKWTRFIATLLILPAVLTLIGWPVMSVARRRKQVV